MSEQPKQFSIRNLLTNSDQYIIPMYQRNYAWEEGEIAQLIQDLIDCIGDPAYQTKNYYIGSLVVFQRPAKPGGQMLFETIDGQQRLTTLVLLGSYLKSLGLNQDEIPHSKLLFDSRPKSSDTMETILEGNYAKCPSDLLDPERVNGAILNGYQLIENNLSIKLKEHGVTHEQFADFLFEKVQLIRVEVPEDTDLNHYFEIMNTRGEQLEKHEILKALILRELERLPDERDKQSAVRCLHKVWEACSNIEKYVQMEFSTTLRSQIFGESWDSLIPHNYPQLAEYFQTEEAVEPEYDLGSDEPPTSLASIISSAKSHIAEPSKKPDKNNGEERFHPTVNFPNFLLHVLRVFTQEDVPLDDKRLIPTFQEPLITAGPEAIKNFTFALLKCKWLFDQYVIKRDFANGIDHWSLKHLRRSATNSPYYRNTFAYAQTNHRILMLLAAFHVSTPTMVYKHWLNASLFYLYSNDRYSAQPPADPNRHVQHLESLGRDFIHYLESLARALVFDRHLASEKKWGYFDIIYRNQGKCQRPVEQLDPSTLLPMLTFGKIENNLVFNYLDYLLWLKHKNKGSEKIDDFKFTFRSSVEHYYPRNPEKIVPLAPDDLNAFGNLCLLSHSKNSRLSNLPPEAKKSDYHGEQTPIDSVKQFLMMQDTSTDSPWTADKIHQHTDDMIRTLCAAPQKP